MSFWKTVPLSDLFLGRNSSTFESGTKIISISYESVEYIYV